LIFVNLNLQKMAEVNYIYSMSQSYLSLTIVEYPTYPYPHNADRSEGMDPGCWEIKWENRNDCLNALAASNKQNFRLFGSDIPLQTLRSVPHLTVTWPNQQHALLPKRGGFFHRGHHVRDNLAVKLPLIPQQVQLRGDDDNVTSKIVPSLGSSSWKHKARTVAVTVDSQSSSEHLSPPNDGDRPITTDDWTVVDTGDNMDFHTSPISPDTATSKQLHVSREHPCGVPSETKDVPEKEGDEVLCTDGVPSPLASNRLWRSEIGSDGAKHPNGQVAALSPT